MTIRRETLFDVNRQVLSKWLSNTKRLPRPMGLLFTFAVPYGPVFRTNFKTNLKLKKKKIIINKLGKRNKKYKTAFIKFGSNLLEINGRTNEQAIPYGGHTWQWLCWHSEAELRLKTKQNFKIILKKCIQSLYYCFYEWVSSDFKIYIRLATSCRKPFDRFRRIYSGARETRKVHKKYNKRKKAWKSVKV